VMFACSGLGVCALVIATVNAATKAMARLNLLAIMVARTQQLQLGPATQELSSVSQRGQVKAGKGPPLFVVLPVLTVQFHKRGRGHIGSSRTRAPSGRRDDGVDPEFREFPEPRSGGGTDPLCFVLQQERRIESRSTPLLSDVN
jgi:hypothetical protein